MVWCMHITCIIIQTKWMNILCLSLVHCNFIIYYCMLNCKTKNTFRNGRLKYEMKQTYKCLIYVPSYTHSRTHSNWRILLTFDPTSCCIFSCCANPFGIETFGKRQPITNICFVYSKSFTVAIVIIFVAKSYTKNCQTVITIFLLNRHNTQLLFFFNFYFFVE